MIYSIAFPVIPKSGGGLILRLWEDSFEPNVPVRFQGRATTFATLLAKYYSLFDERLIAQNRTLQVSLGFESPARDGTLPSVTFQDHGVTGTSACLALYFACLHRLAPQETGPYTSFVLTGGLKFKVNAAGRPYIEVASMSTEMLAAKQDLMRLDSYRPAQEMVLLDSDYPDARPLDQLDVDYLEQLNKRPKYTAHNCLKISASQIHAELLLLGQKLGLEAVHTSSRAFARADDTTEIHISPPAPTPTFGDLLVKALTAYGRTQSVENALAYLAGDRTQVDAVFKRTLHPFDLQLDAFEGDDAEELWARDGRMARNLLLGGPTGSGKTALLDALILRAMVGQEGMAFYLAPTRALATEYHRNFRHRYGNLLKAAHGWTDAQVDEMVVLSTGEDFSADVPIRAGAVGLACVVTEKANVLTAAQQSQLYDARSRVRLIIFDELHMLCEPHRGGVVDLLLAKFRHHGAMERQGEAPLRIVGVSTESLVNELHESKAFTSGNPRSVRPGLNRKAIRIETRRRPVTVAHFIQLMARGVDEPQKPIFVCAFDSTDKRYLTEQEITRVARECHTQALKFKRDLDEKLSRSGGKELRGAPMTRRVVEERLARGYRTVIVAMGSTDSLLAVGTQLTQSRPVVDATRFATECDRSDLNDMMKDKLKELAAHNIFLHSADQPRNIREFIETLFSDTGNTRQKVLLTTETLSYGVNLTADCIVLVGTMFPRERRFDDVAGVEKMALSANAFHNLLGRAGRYGQRDRVAGNGRDEQLQPHAVFLIDAVTNFGHYVTARTESDFWNEVARYYGHAEQGRPFGASALFYPGDKRLGARGDSEVALFLEKTSRAGHCDFPLLDYSYNAFRTICDTLRYLQLIRSKEYGCNADGIKKFLIDWSVYGDLECASHATVASEEQQFERDGLEALIEAMTAKLIKNDYINQDDHSDASLSLTPKAEALIDTGVRPTAIEPIRKYLELAKQRGGRAPAEFISFAFCATPEFWNIAARDLCQIMHWRKLSEPEMGGEDYLVGSKNTFRAVMNKLDISPADREDTIILLDQLYDHTLGLDQHSNRLYAASSYRVGSGEKAQPVLNRIAYFTLCAIIIAWVNGVGENELVDMYRVRDKNGQPIRESPAMEKRPANIKVGISDKLGWLTKAAYKYFSDTPTFDPAMKSALLGLTDRFRSGVSASGLPFLKAVHVDDKFHAVPSRASIEAFVLGKDSTTLTEECKLPRTLWGRRARAFFESELSSKFTWLERRPEIQEQSKELYAALKGLFSAGANRALHTIDDRVKQAIDRWVVQLAHLCGENSGIVIVDQKPVLTVGLKFVSGEMVVLHFGQHPASPPLSNEYHLDADQVFLDSRSDGARSAPRVSVFGALVLISFFARRFLAANAFKVLSETFGPISIRKIVIELANASDLSKVGGTDEALLSFHEPGW